MTATLHMLRAPSDADQAFQVHAAMMKAEAREPTLRANSRWRSARQQIYTAFVQTFAAGSTGGAR